MNACMAPFANCADPATASPARPHVDIGILTIRPDEFRAVLDVCQQANVPKVDLATEPFKK